MQRKPTKKVGDEQTPPPAPKKIYTKDDYINLLKQSIEIRELYIKMLEDKIAAATGRPVVSILPPVASPVPPQKRAKKIVHLICITEHEGPWDDHWTEIPVFLDRYTSPGKTTDRNGEPAYPINELGGAYWDVEDFIVSNPHQKK